MDKLSVVFVMILSVLLLGEKLSWVRWLGGGCVLVGALHIAWKPG